MSFADKIVTAWVLIVLGAAATGVVLAHLLTRRPKLIVAEIMVDDALDATSGGPVGRHRATQAAPWRPAHTVRSLRHRGRHFATDRRALAGAA
jgi:hypothetical protein